MDLVNIYVFLLPSGLQLKHKHTQIMSKLNEEIKALYQLADNLKKEAIQNENIQKFKLASEKYRDLHHKIETIIKSNHPELDNVKASQSTLTYLYESYDCEYAFLLRQKQYDDALNKAKECEEVILKSINLNKELKHKLKNNKEQLKKIKENDNYWEHARHSNKVKQHEPLAEIAIQSGKYIKAWDEYKEMVRHQKKTLRVAKKKKMPFHVLRTAKGNYYASVSNAAQTMLIHLDDKVENNKAYDNIYLEIISFLTEAYESAKLAYESNPEQDEYQLGRDHFRNLIEEVIKDEDISWSRILTELNTNQIVKTIMKVTDEKRYNEANSNEIGSKKFYISLLLGIILVGTVVALIFLIPNPTQLQYFVVRILIALGVAGIAVTLFGDVVFKNKVIQAGGAFALFGLIYLVNPASFITNFDTVLRGSIIVNGKDTAGVNIVHKESQIPDVTNQNGIFEISVPSDRIKDEMNFKLSGKNIDTTVTISKNGIDLRNIKINIKK